jgi:poly(3-hydroxybutyrate) depolymerase
MRAGVVLVAAVLGVSACGSTTKPAPLRVAPFVLRSTLLDRPLHEVLVTPGGGGRGRPLLVFLHGYGATRGETLRGCN